MTFQAIRARLRAHFITAFHQHRKMLTQAGWRPAYHFASMLDAAQFVAHHLAGAASIEVASPPAAERFYSFSTRNGQPFFSRVRHGSCLIIDENIAALTASARRYQRFSSAYRHRSSLLANSWPIYRRIHFAEKAAAF